MHNTQNKPIFDKTFKNMEWCCKTQIKPLFDDIKYKDYFEPIIRLKKENEYIYPNSINKTDILKQSEDNDTIIHYYIKSMTNTVIIVIFPCALDNLEMLNNMMDNLKKNGDIHYIKDIEIDYYTAYNLCFQLYSHLLPNNPTILKILKQIGFLNDGLYRKIKIITYTCTNKDKDIIPYILELQELFINNELKTTKCNNDNNNIKLNYLHISLNTNQTYEYAGLFFHKYSLKFLKRQKSWRILEMYNAKKNLNLLKEFIYKYSQKELEKLIIFSSGSLFTYGVREPNDIDCLLLPCDTIPPSKIQELLDINKILDISYKGTTEYNQIWDDELNNRAKIMGANNYTELITNPKFYYYFMGLKIIRLKCDLLIRYKRARPSQLADLLIIRQMFNLSYKINIPTAFINFNKVLMKDESHPVKKKDFLYVIKNVLLKRYLIDLNLQEIEQWINLDFTEENYNSENNYIDDEDDMENLNDIDIDISQKGGKNAYGFRKIITPLIQNKIYTNYNGLTLNKDDTYINLFNISENDADKKIIYPSQIELIKMCYDPNIVIYSSYKPYLYEGENIHYDMIVKNCFNYSAKLIPKKNKLRIFTFNVHNFVSICNQGIAPIFGTALNPFNKPRDIKKFINLFKMIDADIICFQELVPITKENIKTDIKDLEYIRNNFNFEYLNTLMKSIGYEYKVISNTQYGHFMENSDNTYYYSANGIYSKIPIIKNTTYEYKFLNRNLIVIDIKWNNKLIKIFNCHWSKHNGTSIELQKMGIKEDILIIQANAIYNLILEHKKETNNIILCGDFNTNIFKNNDNISILYKNNFINTNFSNITTNFKQCIVTDFIMLLKNSSLKSVYSNIITTNISDHNGVLTDFI